MSDIDIKLDGWELLLLSPTVGWPGLGFGGIVGAFLWRRRRMIGAIVGAIAGNLAWAFVTLYSK